MFPTERTMSAAAVGATLFGCLFAVQSGLLALTPTLSRVAADFGVSAAAAGQLRATSGAVAALTAVVLLAGRRRWNLRGLLTLGLGLLATAAAGSAAAPTFWAMTAAQVLLGAGVALVLAGGLAAASRWAPDGERARVLSWALVGQPSAWVVGMPVTGMLGDLSWRLAWLVPLTAAALALVGVTRRPAGTPEPPAPPVTTLLRGPGVAGWAAGELLAYAGWAGVLVYCGSLLTDAHGVSVSTAGTALGGGAAGFVLGTLLARRWDARRTLLVTGPALAVAALLLGAVRPTFGISLALFALTALLAGARMFASSTAGLDLAGISPLQAMSLRATSMQLGYLGGSVLGGVGLTLGGWSGLGVVFAAALTLAALVTGMTRNAGASAAEQHTGAPVALAKAGAR